jgi:hypothetical protein
MSTASAAAVEPGTAPPRRGRQAVLHSYTTAFAWAAGLFLAGALITALLYRNRGATAGTPQDEPVLV